MATTESAPRVLLITRNLPPLMGGMERLMQNMAAGISQYSQLTVIGPAGCTQHLPTTVRVHEVPPGVTPFLVLSSWLAIRECYRERFDIVIGGSGLIAPTLRTLSLFFPFKTIIYLHGLDLVVDNYFYQRIFVPCMRGLDRVVVNSVNTRRIAIEKGIKEAATVIVNPGTDLPAMPADGTLAQLRVRYNINYQKIVLFVGRMTRRKGLSQFIRNSLPEILSAEPTAGLVIVGKNPEDSLNQLGEEKDVLSAVAGLQQPDRVTFLGQVSDTDLISCYAVADVQIFPLIDVPGDVEGFGMVAIEAAALGTPTVAFDAGGVADAISEDNGYLITPGDYELLADRVVSVLRERAPTAEACIGHARAYEWDEFNAKIRQVLLSENSR